MSEGLPLGFQLIPGTYEEVASQEKARRLLVENLVIEIARLTVENEELKLAMGHMQRIDALALAVGVMKPNSKLEARELAEEQERTEAARERYNCAGERLSAIAFGVVVGTGLLWSHMIGLVP